MRWIPAILLFAACSHPSAAPSTNAATTCRPVQVTACPPTPEGAECDGTSPYCTSADQECHCGFEVVGGAPPSGPMTWQCAVAVRPDGCPGLSPAAGACCSGPDHDCAYGNNNRYVGACRHGAWVDVKLPPAMP
ncbi:MAG TPA: hypothetical protein VLB44_08125 [Kofleriaceae bacterium]|nr:hypothetical protein [Kofleriaceae bacterium]